MIEAIYDFFAGAPTGSFRNHLAHCVVALGIQSLFFVMLSPFRKRVAPAVTATVIAVAVYFGRSQMQVEDLLRPAPWWRSWLFWEWPDDQALGTVFPLVSSFAILAALITIKSRVTSR